MKEVMMFVSEDGKEFWNREECLAWEKERKEADIRILETCMEMMPHYVTDAVSLYLPYGSDEDVAWAVRPRYMADINIINAYTKTVIHERADLTADDVGKLIFLNFGREKEQCAVFRAKKLLADIKEAFQTVAAKV